MVGETIGSYRILGELGAGGMGTVYLAEHRHLHRKAAIKLLLKEFVARPDLLERFFSEARATSLIEHPGIVQIFDCEVDGQGRPYIVMEYLGGETLATCLRRRRVLPTGEAVAYCRRMAEALAAAHDKGIIHRDVKPDNVFVKPGPPLGIKFVDFGIAKLAGEFHAGQKSRTQTGMVMGTPLYMSPEQCRGAGTVDYRTDIYSLGCVLFEMLSGRPPFQHEGGGELVVAHLTTQAPDVRTANASVPVEVATLVGVMLSKAPADRPQTMHEVAARLATSEPPELAGPALWPASGSNPILPSGARPVTGAQPLRPPSAPPSEPPRTTPPVQTTLRSTASEIVTGEDEGEVKIPRRRTGAVLATLLVFGGAAAAGLLWTRSRSHDQSPGVSSPAAAGPATSAPISAGPASPPPQAAPVAKPPAPAAAPPPAPSSPPATSPPAAGTAPAATAPPVAHRPAGPGPAGAMRRHAAATPPRVRAPVRFYLQSEPASAEICLEGDRRLIGYTPRTIELPPDGRKVTFLVYLPAHRLKRVTVRAARDATKSVRLEPVGGDELTPTGCLR